MSNLAPPLTPHELFILRALVRQHGIARAAKLLGLPRHAVLTANGEAPMREGSVALMRIALARVDASANPQTMAR